MFTVLLNDPWSCQNSLYHLCLLHICLQTGGGGNYREHKEHVHGVMPKPWLYISPGLQVGAACGIGKCIRPVKRTEKAAEVAAQLREGSPEETTGWLPALTDQCAALFFHTHRRNVGFSDSAVSLNRLGLFDICRENLSMWEKIACGEVEDVVPSRLYDSGPVKVDNWLPKSLLARQRNTTLHPATDLVLCKG